MTAIAAISSTFPRIEYRQPVTTAGFVDAAWWPRTRELESELLPVLLDLISAGRPIVRVIFNLDAWDYRSRRLDVDGFPVKLGGFHSIDPLLVTFIERERRERINVLVIDPGTTEETARRVMDVACASDTVGTREEIMNLAGALQ